MKFSFSKLFSNQSPNDSKFRSQYSSVEVAQYYEDYTDIYIKATGDFIQAYRTNDTDSLMEYLTRSMDLRDGMRVLDAGCGICAPAIWIAQRFPNVTLTCVTNSETQFQIANKKIRESGFEQRIDLVKGDYQRLPEICGQAEFDRTVFLESLGHHQDLDQVISGAKYVLKPGGKVYVKDFFRRHSKDFAEENSIDEVINVINRNYFYNVMNLPYLIEELLINGYTLNFAKTLEIDSDLGITIAFEDAAGRLTYPAFSNIRAVDWYEVLAIRD